MFQENDSEIIRIENKSEKANENSEQVYIDAADETMEHFCNKKFIYSYLIFIFNKFLFF